MRIAFVAALVYAAVLYVLTEPEVLRFLAGTN